MIIQWPVVKGNVQGKESEALPTSLLLGYYFQISSLEYNTLENVSGPVALKRGSTHLGHF